MKRSLMVILVLGLMLALAGMALAAAAKPPSSVCLQWDFPFNDLSCLAPKAGGKITTAAGSKTFYAIGGEHITTFQIDPNPPVTVSVPVTGAGHVSGTSFHFSYTGGAPFDVGEGVTTNTLVVEGTLNLAVSPVTGTVNFHWELAEAGYADGNDTGTGVDCKTVTIPYSATAGFRSTLDSRSK